MSLMPDGNSAALRQHEADQVRLDLACDEAEVMAQREATTDVNDAKIVAEIILDYEVDPSACLARCFASLDAACKGEQIGRDAITTALHNLRRDMIAKRVEVIFDDCVEAVGEPPCRCRDDCYC